MILKSITFLYMRDSAIKRYFKIRKNYGDYQSKECLSATSTSRRPCWSFKVKGRIKSATIFRVRRSQHDRLSIFPLILSSASLHISSCGRIYLDYRGGVFFSWPENLSRSKGVMWREGVWRRWSRGEARRWAVRTEWVMVIMQHHQASDALAPDCGSVLNLLHLKLLLATPPRHSIFILY